MNNRASDLLGVYALGAVDASERRFVERSASRDPGLRADLDELLLTVDMLDDVATEGIRPPGPAVWKRIEVATATVPRTEPEGPTTRRRPFRPALKLRRLSRLVPLTVVAVVALVVLGARVVQLDSSNGELQAALDAPLSAALDQALADPGSARVTLAAPLGSPVATTVDVVYQSDGTGYVLADSLPALQADRTYQLWAIVGDRVISAGVLGDNPGISPFRVVGELAGLAITEEVAGGVVSSENDPVAVWLAAA